MPSDTVSNSLQEFISHARGKKMDHATIRQLLLSAGWKEKDIAQALTAQSLDMPVPMPPDAGGAREAFMHLLTFVSLYITVISAIVLHFNFINRWFPDPAFYYYNYETSDYYLTPVRWSMAAVIVAFPLLLWFSRSLLKDMRRHPEKAWSKIRRWLTYLTLFAAAVAMITDIITLLFRLLEGELSTRFILKFLVVLAAAGLTFGYYFICLNRTEKKNIKPDIHKTYAAISSTIVIATLVWGFVLIGSPLTERAKKFDERRLEDLQAIHREVLNIVYGETRWDTSTRPAVRSSLPENLIQVQKQAQRQRLDIADPQTNAPYGYEITGGFSYKLCADFFAERKNDYNILWNHPAGYHCYSFDIGDKWWE